MLVFFTAAGVSANPNRVINGYNQGVKKTARTVLRTPLPGPNHRERVADDR